MKNNIHWEPSYPNNENKTKENYFYRFPESNLSSLTMHADLATPASRLEIMGGMHSVDIASMIGIFFRKKESAGQ